MIVMMAAQMAPAAAAPACTPATIRAAAPSGWNDPVVVRTGATVAIGRAAALTLGPAATAGFAVPPTKNAETGAALSVVVPRAGRWRVSLDAPVWVDVIGPDRRAATSVAHAHGVACSGVRKAVDFDLPAGRYLVQLSAPTAQPVRVMVAPAG